MASAQAGAARRETVLSKRFVMIVRNKAWLGFTGGAGSMVHNRMIVQDFKGHEECGDEGDGR